MKDKSLTLGLAAIAAIWLVWLLFGPATPDSKYPENPAPAPVQPGPNKPEPKPKRPWCPKEEASVEASVGGPVSPDGEPIQCDLPDRFHMKNTGGNDRWRGNPSGEPGKGYGLCVFTSIEHSAIHQNVPALIGFQKWMTTKPGGGHPEKVDAMIDKFCKERGVAKPRYIQVTGSDLDILRLACKTGRMPAVTYCVSPTGRYGGQYIDHMVNAPHATKYFAVLDNNHPGAERYEWLTEAEFKRSYIGRGGGWSVILLEAPPPPAPTN